MSDDIVQLDLDKPRRGERRFWPEILDDAGEDKAAASTIARIERMTEPLRLHLRSVGRPTDRLLVCWGRSAKPRMGVRQNRESDWWPIADSLNFNRLRRSAPSGVAREPNQHSQATHLHYVRTDPESLRLQQQAAAVGVLDALERAREALSIPQVGDEVAIPQNDALVANCSNPDERPTTGRACEAAFFSFLDCLECDNAVTANRLLPRQIAALAVLDSLRDVAGDRWTSAYSRRYYLLSALVERSTPSERAAAIREETQFRPIIQVALKEELATSHAHTTF